MLRIFPRRPAVSRGARAGAVSAFYPFCSTRPLAESDRLGAVGLVLRGPKGTLDDAALDAHLTDRPASAFARYASKNADRQPAGEHEGSAVAEERQRNSRH